MKYKVQFKDTFNGRWYQSINFHNGGEMYLALPAGNAKDLRKCQANKYIKFKQSKNKLLYRIVPMENK